MKVDDAKKNLSDVQAKAAEQRIKLVEHEREIEEISVAAQLGEPDARRRLNALIAETSALEAEQRSIAYAVKGSEKQLAEAEAAARDAVLDANADKALARVESFARRGERLDAKIESVVAELSALCREAKDLESIGYPPATHALIVSNMRRALLTKLMFTEFKIEFLAPSERVSIPAVIESWTRSIRARATARLSRNKAAKAA